MSDDRKRRIRCEHCGRKMFDNNGLIQHMKARHGNEPRCHLYPRRCAALRDAAQDLVSVDDAIIRSTGGTSSPAMDPAARPINPTVIGATFSGEAAESALSENRMVHHGYLRLTGSVIGGAT
jgi:hypothetical protein